MVEHDYPVALLIGLNGHERIVRTVDPPPPVFEFPIPQRLSLEEGDPSQPTVIPKRVFRRSQFLAKEIIWWRAYNEGRSRTPERARIYLESIVVP